MTRATDEFLRALSQDRAERAKELLDAHPEIARFSIHAAAAVGDADAVAAFIEADPDSVARATPPDGMEPIIYAASGTLKQLLGVSNEAHVATVRVLLDAGASANASAPLPDVSDSIPVLYFASVSNAVPVVRLLLERGAQPTDGESVYHAAQHDLPDVLAALQEYGADLSHGPAKYGNTPLHFLAAHRVSNPISDKVVRGMLWLLEHGADPNVPSHGAPEGHPDVDAGERPLHRAAASGFGEHVMRMLIDHGAVVDALRDDGVTAYALAVRAGNTSAAEILARAGADITRLSPIDRLLGACNTVDAAAAHQVVAQQPGILDTLTPRDREALGNAIFDNRIDVLTLMLSIGWPLTQESEWGGTPLHWAAWNGRTDMVTLLLERGAPVNLRDSRYGSSPIAWTCHGSLHCGRGNDVDYPAIAQLLLDAGSTRPESFNQWGESPESMARPSVVRVLTERGFVS